MLVLDILCMAKIFVLSYFTDLPDTVRGTSWCSFGGFLCDLLKNWRWYLPGDRNSGVFRLCVPFGIHSVDTDREQSSRKAGANRQVKMTFSRI